MNWRQGTLNEGLGCLSHLGDVNVGEFTIIVGNTIYEFASNFSRYEI
jgi:hypothetical protein